MKTDPGRPEGGDGSTCVHRIVERLRATVGDVRVADVRIGLGYTGVSLEDGRAGLAYTFRDLAKGGCSVFHGKRPLAGRAAADLLSLLDSADAIETAVGLACVNALANTNEVESVEGDVLDLIDLRPDDDVAMVGYFGPLVEPLRKRVGTLTIYEREEATSPGVSPAREAHDGLARSSIALITSTSFVNGTVDALLEAARGCREVVMLGASTPLLPDVLGPAGATMLSGVVVRDSVAVLRVVSEGGGTRQFGPYVRKVGVRASNALAGAGR